MALAFKGLFDKRKVALARARFHAWWEGEEFDEAAAQAAIDAAANDASAKSEEDAEDELFDAPQFDAPPRLTALAALWGEGRVRPGDAASEKLEPGRLGIAADGVLAVLGPGLEAPLAAIAGAHQGKIEAFEWRDETFEALKHGLTKAKLDERIGLARIDLETHVFPLAFYDGLISVDDFAYCGHAPHLALQIVKTLKPGAAAAVECYVGLKSAEYSTAFASAFAEPQIRAHGDLLQIFSDAGLALESDDDLTEAFLENARKGFKHLGEILTAAAKLEVAVVQELAWEAEAWRMRMKLLAQRRLERRRFILRRPAETQTEPKPQA
ncbi:MAG: hypothetical protein JSS00_00515 [Proteobacteria bacterium]|nr:hypothetical protein [Pseudomonadota bacterium]